MGQDGKPDKAAAGAAIRRVLWQQLHDPESSFSVGALGALAEFHRAAGEPLILDDSDGLAVATERGALRIDRTAGVVARAYELPSRQAERWQNAVVFCLPEAQAAMNRRRVVTELGPDREAVRPQDRAAILFDMGLGAGNVDFCVRTAEPALLAALRQGGSRSILEPGNPTMAAILEASPHRVALSRLARAEVFQAIGRERTPEGPHTHVLPHLLASGRSHEPEIPVPAGWVPGLNLYPANPLTDGLGRARPFDPAHLAAFEALLALWGDADYLAAKAAIRRAFDAGLSPDRIPAATTALAATAQRVALRQLRQVSGTGLDLSSWTARFDRPQENPHNSVH